MYVIYTEAGADRLGSDQGDLLPMTPTDTQTTQNAPRIVQQIGIWAK